MLSKAAKAAKATTSAARRAVTDLSKLPKPGTKIHGFTLLRSKHVPELELTALHLKHDNTGAEHLHIAREDSNNVFSIGFKTNPPDDTGVPHILEHTTLCGSEKYPCRDPFFKMLPRTLANFMNAFTASDHTFYPFATTNEQDFSNLMSVYMDATLHPLLKEADFTQEGWRIGPENPQALLDAGKGESGSEPKPEDSKLVFKGVVYNEMKGQMSDAGYLFYIRFQDHIFPDINNSGGDPQKITDLTYEQLKSFHAEHYHPSNAKLFTYGDMPLEKHLEAINAQLASFGKIQSEAVTHRPIDLSAGPKEVQLYGPVDPLVDPSKQYKTSVSWVLGDTADVVESFSLSLISALLMDGYGSPLYKGLIETGLGTDWSPNTGYDSSGRLGIFSVGLTGVEEANVPKVKSKVQEILRNVRDAGFDRSKIDGYLHQLELSLKHKTANFGMSLLHRLKPKWFNGIDPFESLAWNDTLAAFETEMAKGGYLEGLMDKYLLNDNTFTFTMAPSPNFNKELAQEEETRLKTKIADAVESAGGEEQARAALEAKEIELLAEQAKKSDAECLPTVTLADIPRHVDPVPLLKVQWHVAPTNGLTYFRAINEIQGLPTRLRQMIPLFTDAIFRLGTKDMSMEQLEDLIKLKTGGISVGYHSATSPVDCTLGAEGLSFSGMALDRHVPTMLELLRKLVLETNFDGPEAEKQIIQLIQASADGAVNDIASSGHVYARRAAEAQLSQVYQRHEDVSGLTQVRLITELAANPTPTVIKKVILQLKEIQEIALAGNIRYAITCDSGSVSDNFKFLTDFARPLRPKLVKLRGRHKHYSDRKVFYPLPYQVYYGGMAAYGIDYNHPYGPSLQIVSQVLTHKHLHKEIREKGGAYGGGSYFRPVDGIFGYYSYRDPNPVNTLRIMEQAAQWALGPELTKRDIEEAKISVFQSLDAPRAVNEEGMGEFVYGVTDAMKQARREKLLNVGLREARTAVGNWLVPRFTERGRPGVAFLGEEQPWFAEHGWEVQRIGVEKPKEVVEEPVPDVEGPKEGTEGPKEGVDQKEASP